MGRLLPPVFRPGRLRRAPALALAALALTWWVWRSREGMADGHAAIDHAAIDHNSLDAAADAICRQNGWKPFRPASHQDQPRRVYDLCMVNAELDWLEIRLNTTFAEVDYFVIVESAQTFTGLPKPLTIRDHWDRFGPYHAKMLYHELRFPPGFDPPRAWDREDLQRNALFLQVLDPAARAAAGSPPLQPPQAVPRAGDVLVVADVDEIPRPLVLRALRRCRFPRRLTLQSRFYYYSFQFRREQGSLRWPWPHPQATFVGARPGDTVLPVNLRNGDSTLSPWAVPVFGGELPSTPPLLASLARAALDALRRWHDSADLADAAWHCSSCYATMAELLHKLESVSHVWMNHPLFRDRDRAADHVRAGRDLWDRPSEQYVRVANNTDLPRFLLEQPQRFGYLLDRDGASAGFSDYP